MIATSRPPRCPRPEACTATHTPSLVTARPSGRLPTFSVAVIRGSGPVGSIFRTRSPNSMLTQTKPCPTATAAGAPPSLIVAVTEPLDASMCESVPSSEFATQTALAP